MPAWNENILEPTLSQSVTKPPLKKRVSTSSHYYKSSLVLREYDILCGRCKGSFSNVGNRRFRVTIAMNLEAYRTAHTKKQKSKLIIKIATTLHEVGARFLKPTKGGKFIELSENQVHEKIGHALRDMSVSHQQSGTSSNPQLDLWMKTKSLSAASSSSCSLTSETSVKNVASNVDREEPKTDPMCYHDVLKDMGPMFVSSANCCWIDPNSPDHDLEPIKISEDDTPLPAVQCIDDVMSDQVLDHKVREYFDIVPEVIDCEPVPLESYCSTSMIEFNKTLSDSLADSLIEGEEEKRLNF